MGPERAMGNQEAVGPPEKAEGSPAPQRIGAGVQIGGQPQTTGPTAGCGDQSCRPSQRQANGDAERQAQNPNALVVAATRCQALRASVRSQADALGQNLPGGAISSAVEHLPYKEIVTGSIPVSPISKSSAALGFFEISASACQRLRARAVACLLGTELASQDAFRLSHHFEAGLSVSSGVGSVHAFHVLLFRCH